VEPPAYTAVYGRLLSVEAAFRFEDDRRAVVIWAETEPDGETERLAIFLEDVDELIQGLIAAKAEHEEIDD